MRRRKRNQVVVIFVGILLVGVLLKLMLFDKTDTFAEGFKTIEKLEKQYGTSFKTEQLNWSMAPFETIDNLTRSIEAIEVDLGEQESADAQALRQFIKARKLMLRSEKNWHLAERIGDIGEVKDEEGFSCAEYPYIIKAAMYYNNSWIFGLHATRALDSVISDYKDVESATDLVGVNEKKSKFYTSPFYQAADHFRNNLFALEKNCGFNFELTPEALKVVDLQN